MRNSPKKRNTVVVTSTMKTSTLTRSGSPLKVTEFNDTFSAMQADNTHLQMAMGEKDVEMERMQTTLQALNGKLALLTDIRTDIDQHKEYLENSEEKREELQKHIVEASNKIMLDTKASVDRARGRDTEIVRLNQSLSDQRDAHNQKEKDNIEVLDNLAQEHYSQIQVKVTEIDRIEQAAAAQAQLKDKEYRDSLNKLQVDHSRTLSIRDDNHASELRTLDAEKTRREISYLANIKSMNELHASELNRLHIESIATQERHETEFKRQREEYAAELQRLAQEVENTRLRHEAELKRLAQEAEKTLRLHEAEIKRLQNEMRDAANRAAQELSRTKDLHHSEMTLFRQDQEQKDNEHRRNIDQMIADHASKLQTMNFTHETEKRTMVDTHTRELTTRITVHTTEITRLIESHRLEMSEKDKTIYSLKEYIQKVEKETSIEINSLKLRLQETLTTLEEKVSIILSLEELLHKKRDVEAQLEEALTREGHNQEARDKLQRELEHATDYILELEEKVYKANKTSLELLKQLKDAEVEIETLKQYIIDLKQRIAVYIPVKEDAIDKKLAEFINNYPERSKLKIMFMRESEGTYQFGTKRVAVKVEKDNIKIRVGGGYLSIDEFLDQYTPVELEKLERKDPLKRFSEKVAIQKTIVNAGVRESSPIRQSTSPGRRSPLRKTAI